MYIHYARIDLNGKECVQFLFCSKSHLDWSVTERKNKAFVSADDWKQSCIPIVSMLKQIPTSQRVYDTDTKVWTILKQKWNDFLPLLKLMGFKYKSYANLYTDLIDKIPASHQKYDIPNAEEFFYQQTEQEQNAIFSSSELTKDQIETKLKEIFMLPALTGDGIDLKKLYRKAALKFHPDLNGGDATKMTELNYYWQEYQKVRTI